MVEGKLGRMLRTIPEVKVNGLEYLWAIDVREA
jgi:uncharacterized protein (DUF3820 family)